MKTVQGKLTSDLVCAAEAIRDGKIVAYPTDTTYALAVKALDPVAVGRLAALKSRDESKPISVSLANPSHLYAYAEVSQVLNAVVDEFLPGPITLILTPSVDFPTNVTSPSGKVGFRVPDSNLVKELIRLVGEPITATSANPGGHPEAISSSDFLSFPASFLSGIEWIILEDGPLSGSASSVVEVSDNRVRVLRSGPVSKEQIEERLKWS